VTFGLPPAERDPLVGISAAERHLLDVRAGPARPRVRRTRRTLPWWPLILIVVGTMAAGPVGLLLATSVAGAVVVLRLRMIVAEQDDRDLPRLGWSRRPREPVLPGFTRTVGSLEWGLVSAFDFDTSLRPRLTRVAAARLADRHGIDIARQPAEAARRLGREAWVLLDPARAPVADRSIHGPDRAAVARVLDAIERI
jgi:hypothetical protein